MIPPDDPRLSAYLGLALGESPTRALDFARVCVAKAERDEALRPRRPESARDCTTCGGAGETSNTAHYRITVEGVGELCGDCAGRGWRRDPFADNANAIQELFRRCWCEDGFSAELVAAPRAALRAAGLGVADGVEVVVVEDRHGDWCGMCQLSRARIDVTPGEGSATGASSPLQSIFDACWTEPEVVEALHEGTTSLARFGITLSNNIRFRLLDGDAPRVELVVGHRRHICTCDELDLYDLVLA